ncbi:MAG: GspH/FimT family pseudopilin [Rhodocyclaceae bacterium]|nr:GspH/FimT family pseudopilin [Rhodocyclaceae bacterium]
MFRHAGFTVIELMIAIVLLAILLTLGTPAFSIYISNVKLRSTAETFFSGIQMARSEAIRRNTNVDFVLTNNDVSGTNINPAASANGRNWLVRTSDLASFIESKTGAESGGSRADEASPVQVTGSVATVTFNGLGSTTLPTAAVFQFTNPSGGACTADGGPMRCLNVVVSPSGQARLCDPAVTAAQTAAGDTRGCL